MVTTVVNKRILPWDNISYVDNPYPWYQEARENYPIYKDVDGTYVITRYEDVVKFGKLPSLSIVPPDDVDKGPWGVLKDTVVALDPPKHTASRRPLNKWFTPKLVKSWSEAASEYAVSYIDNLSDGEIFDANMYLGVAPAHKAMCKALQVPDGDFEPVIFCMHKAMAALSAVAGTKQNEEATEAFNYLFERIKEMMQWKVENPGNGLADALLDAISAGKMTESEVMQSMVLLWGSGGHNPSYVVGTAVEYFAKNPEVFEIYKNEPEKRTTFISEIYRLYPPELTFSRYATEDIEIHGVPIKPGECVKFIMDSANRDPLVFPNPDKLDLNRPADSTQHCSFGMGIHQCAGQTISRGVIETVLNVIAEKVKSFSLEGEPVMDNSDRSRAYVNLPVSIEKEA